MARTVGVQRELSSVLRDALVDKGGRLRRLRGGGVSEQYVSDRWLKTLMQSGSLSRGSFDGDRLAQAA